MIKRSGDYTGSTEHDFSESDPPKKRDDIAANQVRKLDDTKDSALNLSQDEFLVTESKKATAWLKSGMNCVYDSLIFQIIQTQISPVNGFDAESPKILVVDDHSVSRMTAVTLLGLEGYAVIEADGGVAAIEMVKQQQPDLILLDVMMPGMDGFEVCRILKQDEHTRLIPIIFITALNDRRSRIRGIEVGADDFLSKPFDRVELTARVKSLVQQKLLNEDLEHSARAKRAATANSTHNLALMTHHS